MHQHILNTSSNADLKVHPTFIEKMGWSIQMYFLQAPWMFSCILKFENPNKFHKKKYKNWKPLWDSCDYSWLMGKAFFFSFWLRKHERMHSKLLWFPDPPLANWPWSNLSEFLSVQMKMTILVISTWMTFFFFKNQVRWHFWIFMV